MSRDSFQSEPGIEASETAMSTVLPVTLAVWQSLVDLVAICSLANDAMDLIFPSISLDEYIFYVCTSCRCQMVLISLYMSASDNKYTIYAFQTL